MSAAESLAYTYRYPFASNLVSQGDGLGLRLATCGGPEANPHFFRGRLAHPKEIADQLLTLGHVVSSRFYLPNAMRLIDPVVTSNDNMLRFEGFSSCCSVYARADIKAEAFEIEFHGRGTTNVDFNSGMRTALARIRPRDEVHLSVGADELALVRGQHTVVERKVLLPVRWLRGFTEVQAYQLKLRMRYKVSAPDALRFIQGMPRSGGPKQPSWVVPIGHGIRLSQRESKDGVRVTGTDRLRLLEGLVGSATELHIWEAPETGTSAWELVFPSGRFTLMLSPELSRGFSGEGQMLRQLAGPRWQRALLQVRAELRWQSRIDAPGIAQRCNLSLPEVQGALATFAARGLVGYDAAEETYFHRELPFDFTAAESLQPRLKSARVLIAGGGLRVLQRRGAGDAIQAVVVVPGTGVEHRVYLSPEGDKCTCPWHAKNRGERGPCKHVLAARILVEGNDATTVMDRECS